MSSHFEFDRSRSASSIRRNRSGFSLLEMVMASALIVGALVPTMSVMRDAMSKSRDMSRRNLLANYAVSVLEARCASLMDNWSSTTTSGNFSGDGHATIRYTATSSDSAGQGGLTNQLMHIQVTVFDDTDADASLNANELRVVYRTKIARLQSYEDEE